MAPRSGIASAGTMFPRDDTQGAGNGDFGAPCMASSAALVNVMCASPPNNQDGKACACGQPLLAGDVISVTCGSSTVVSMGPVKQPVPGDGLGGVPT